MTKGIGANMLKVGSKRRRTKAQVKADKEAAAHKDEQDASTLAELAQLRARVQGLENEANQGKAASSLLSQMISAGHVEQDSEQTIIVHAKSGAHRFGVDQPGQNQEDGQ